MGILSKKPLKLSLWLAFDVGVLARYYKQIWALFHIGLTAWVKNNASLNAAIRPIWDLLKSRRVVINLPAFPGAMERNLHAIWGAALVLLCAGFLGSLLLKLLRIPLQDWREAIPYKIAVGLGTLSYLMLGLALFAQYKPQTIRFLLMGITIGGACWFIYKRLFLRRNLKPKLISNRFRSESFWDRIWLTISILAFVIAFIGALAPETEFDALRYHLWLPKLWLENGSPVDLVNEYISLYPLHWELLFGAAMVLGNSVAAKLLHFATFPLTSLLVYQLTKRFLPKASPWLSVAIFTTIPTVLWEATTAYIDLALAFYIGLAIYALLKYIYLRRWQWLVLAGLNLGFALATKHLALLILVLAIVGLAWVLWRDEHNWRKSLLPVAIFAGISLLLPLPWYFRSWIASGNPFFPDLYKFFGAFPAQRWNHLTEHGLTVFKNHFGYSRSLLNLLMLPWNMTVHAARFGGSLGPIFLLSIPGILWHRFRSTPVSWLLGLVVGYIALWASPISSFQMRFIVAISPIMAVLASISFTVFMRQFNKLNWGNTFSSAMLAGLIFLNFPLFTSLHESDRVKSEGWLTHVIHELPIKVVIGAESEEAYLERKIPSYDAWQYINQNLPVDGVILTFSDGDHYYSERWRLWSNSPLAGRIIQEAADGNPEKAVEELRCTGVGYILFDKRELGGINPGASMLLSFEQSIPAFEPLYEDGEFVLYRIG